VNQNKTSGIPNAAFEMLESQLGNAQKLMGKAVRSFTVSPGAVMTEEDFGGGARDKWKSEIPDPA